MRDGTHQWKIRYTIEHADNDQYKEEREKRKEKKSSAMTIRYFSNSRIVSANIVEMKFLIMSQLIK